MLPIYVVARILMLLEIPHLFFFLSSITMSFALK